MVRPIMEEQIRSIIEQVGEDPEREGLLKTPERVAKSYEYLTSGYTVDLDAVVNNALFESENNQMVICKDIEVYSLCEHHMLPFFGKCHIGYIPRNKVIGVSKLARITDMFARRLQIQERLTTQIAETLIDVLDAEGVGVVIQAQHLCMMMRGVTKQNSNMVSSAMLGTFRENLATREEFLRLISLNS